MTENTLLPFDLPAALASAGRAGSHGGRRRGAEAIPAGVIGEACETGCRTVAGGGVRADGQRVAARGVAWPGPDGSWPADRRAEDPERWTKVRGRPIVRDTGVPEWVAPTLFAWRVLRPLLWFGLVECRADGEDLEDASWRKCALFDRFLRFLTDLVRTEGSLH